MKTEKNLITAIGLLIVFSAGSFYAGSVYGGKNNGLSNQDGNIRSFSSRGGGNFGNEGGGRGNSMGGGMGSGRMGGGGGFANGEIIKKDDQSVTIKLRDGSSKIIYFTASSTVSKSVDGSKDDLIIGQNILANGKASPDGSVIADFVQLRPGR